MPNRYYEKDGNLSFLKDRTVAIIGYGSQGHAHALNLRDSGVDVVVGLPASSKSVAKAQSAGLKVLSPGDAAKAASVVMILVPGVMLQRPIFAVRLHLCPQGRIPCVKRGAMVWACGPVPITLMHFPRLLHLLRCSL